MIKEELDRKQIAELVRDIRSELTSLKGSRIMDDEYEGTDEDHEGYIRDAINRQFKRHRKYSMCWGSMFESVGQTVSGLRCGPLCWYRPIA